MGSNLRSGGIALPDQTPTVGMERKLAAIFSTDVAGYSRLMGDDEEATIRTLTAYRALISSLIEHHRGRVVDAPGDNLLAEFASVVDAVRCAVEIQHALTEQNAELPDHRRMQFRIGINLGDVIIEGERLYGDGVNIAARLESLAIPGGICISGTVYDQVKGKLALSYDDLGAQSVKNIADPVRVYRVVMDAAATALAEQAALRHAQPERTTTPGTVSQSPRAHKTRTGVLVLTGLVLITGAIAAVSYLSRPSLSPATVPAALPLPDKPSLMVMPFVNMSKDPDQEYFSDGLTEVLTGDLSKISGLFVIARNSAFTYKGKAVKVQDVGREMGVRYVLEGSVLKADNQVRINTQLIDATTGYHLWSEHYDRPLQNILTLQDEIVQQVIVNLKVKVFEAELERVRRIPTDNLTAYHAFLRGLEYSWRFTKEGNAQARQMYEKALALDPQYAEAYASLSGTYYVEWLWRWSQDPQILEQALALAQKAVTLGDSLPSAHGQLGMVYALKQQYDQALAESTRAVALDPNSADAHARQAEVLNFVGRPEEALRSVEQAMRLNPHYPPWYLAQAAWAYNSTGQYEEAITVLKTVLRLNPNFLSAHFFLATSYLAQWAFQLNSDTRTLEQASVAAQQIIAVNESFPPGHAILAGVYLCQRQYELAIAEMERAIALDPNSATLYAVLAEMLGWMGRPEESLERVEQALRRKPTVVDDHLASIGAAYNLAGKPEEAIAPLKQFTTRYPNILGSHLGLAAAYSKLGKEAEARAEAAEVLRLNPNYSLEVARQRFPLKDQARLEHELAILRKAGLK